MSKLKSVVGSLGNMATKSYNAISKQTGITMFALASIFGVADAYSQQGFSTMVISPDQNSLTATTRDVANGENINTVDGPKFFVNRNNAGYIVIYDETTGKVYETSNGTPGTDHNQSNEPIGNATASYNTGPTANFSLFTDQADPSNTLPIETIATGNVGTINGNPLTDATQILRQQFDLTNLNSLGDNRRVLSFSRQSGLSPSGIRNGISDGIKKVNGVWIHPAYGPLGNPLSNQGPTLGLDDLVNTQQQAGLINNPTKDIFRITDGLPNDNTYDIKIFSINGHKVKEIKNNLESTDIDVADLHPGIYLVQATSQQDNRTFIKKLVKQ